MPLPPQPTTHPTAHPTPYSFPLPVPFAVPADRLQRAVADAVTQAGPQVGLSRVSGGSTQEVFRLRGTGIVRVNVVAGGTVEDVEAAWAAAAVGIGRSSRLAAAGVPVPRPHHAAPVPVVHDGWLLGVATIWQDLGEPGPVDFEAFGAAARALHDAGTKALSGDLSLTPVGDVAALERRLEAALDRRLLTLEEHAALVEWPTRIGRYLDECTCAGTTPAGTQTLVHDDLWPKNVVTAGGGGGTYLVDLDNLGWGPANHDLAFVTRAVEKGAVNPQQAEAFVAGYGRPLPDRECAWRHAYVHRFRWVLNMIERRDRHEQDAAQLADELRRWDGPSGPRPRQ